MANDTVSSDTRGHSDRLTQTDRSSRDAALATPVVRLLVITLSFLGVGCAVTSLGSARPW
jgi:hypothetical protein